MTDEKPALLARALGKRYRRRWALKAIDLSIPAGRVVALVGPNGAGKTTLLHVAMGLLGADCGELLVLGRSPGPASLPDVGFVAQDKPLYREFRVRELIELGARLNHRWDRPYAVSRIAEFDIDPKRRVNSLSGGQQAQVALTLALAKRPRLLLLDEPTANLDPLARRQFLHVVATQAAATGVTVVHSSHDLADLDRGCDHLVVIRDASVVLAGDLNDILSPGRSLEDLVLSTLDGSATEVAA